MGKIMLFFCLSLLFYLLISVIFSFFFFRNCCCILIPTYMRWLRSFRINWLKRLLGVVPLSYFLDTYRVILCLFLFFFKKEWTNCYVMSMCGWTSSSLIFDTLFKEGTRLSSLLPNVILLISKTFKFNKTSFLAPLCGRQNSFVQICKTQLKHSCLAIVFCCRSCSSRWGKYGH